MEKQVKNPLQPNTIVWQFSNLQFLVILEGFELYFKPTYSTI